MKTLQLALILTVLSTGVVNAQESKKERETSLNLKTFVIEREIPGAGDLSADELKGISQASCSVLNEMGPTIVWEHSYVTGDKVYCVYKAASKELVLEHAKKGGFPANLVSEVSSVISPATARD